MKDARHGLSLAQELITLSVPAAVLVAFATLREGAHDLAAFARPAAGVQPAASLRVCADPNNLPFSNRAGEEFENRIAELIGRDLGKPVEYTFGSSSVGASCAATLVPHAGCRSSIASRPRFTRAFLVR